MSATIPSDIAPGTYGIQAVGRVLAVEFCGPASGNVARTEFVVRDPSEVEPRFTPIKPTFDGPLQDGFSPSQIHLKFVQDTDIRLDDGELGSASGIDLGAVQRGARRRRRAQRRAAVRLASGRRTGP